MPEAQCKRLKPTSHIRPNPCLGCLLLAGLIALAGLSACGTQSRPRVISVRALETAAAVEPKITQRAIVSDMAELNDFCYPLGQRLSLLQIRTADHWDMLRRCAPELGPAPDFRRGMVIGLVSRAGLPLNGTWPVHFDAVRVYNGAGFAIARFHGGSFLPDGTTYLETAQFDGLAAVLMVEINGTRFCPE